MKRVVLGLFLFIFLALANIARADNLDDVFNNNSCADMKSQLIAVASAETLNSIDFKYMTALECNMNTLHKNMIVKMLYMMFGDFSLKSMDLTIGVSSLFLDEKVDFYNNAKSEVESSVTTFKSVQSVMKGLSNLVCVIVLILVSIFWLYYLFNSAHDGSIFGRSYNIMWTSIRLLATVFLVIPISGFDDYSSVQVLVVVAATLGTLLANVVWFIMPVFEYLYMDDVLEIKENNEVSNKLIVSSIVDKNIKMHLCDIQARKGLYVDGLDIKDMTKENIEGSNFGQCLKNKRVSLLQTSTKLALGLPAEIRATKECALSDDAEKRVSVECGNVAFKTDALSAGTLSPESYLNNYQTEMRQIAYNIIGRYCVDRKISLDKLDENAYIKECAKVLTADSLSYESRKGSQVIAVYREAPGLGDIISSINSVKDEIYQAMSSSSESIIKVDTATSKEVSDKIAMSLIKGWMSASSFVLDLGSEYKNRETKYNEIFSAIQVINNNKILGSDNVGSILVDGEKTNLARSIVNSNSDLYDYLDTISSGNTYVANKTEGESILLSLFFPGIKQLKEFNGNQDLISNRQNADSCQEDFNQCARITLNPLVKMIRMGSDMASNSITSAAAAFSVNLIISYAAKKFDFDSSKLNYTSSISEFFGYLFMGYALLGLLIAYLPAIIIFSFFIGNAFGWFIIVVQMMVIAPLWIMMHLFPNKDQGFAGKAASGYKMLIDIILRPSFIVFGAFVTFIMMSIMIAILNVLFGIVLNTFVFFSSPTGVIEFVTNYVVHLIYMIMIIVVMYRSSKAMYKIPNALMNWFEMENYEETNGWNEITSRVQNLIVTDLRKVIRIAR